MSGIAKLSARFCPLCGTQHAVEKGKANPWTPHITRQEIELARQMAEALIGMLQAFDNDTYGDQFKIGSDEDRAIFAARAAVAAWGDK